MTEGKEQCRPPRIDQQTIEDGKQMEERFQIGAKDLRATSFFVGLRIPENYCTTRVRTSTV